MLTNDDNLFDIMSHAEKEIESGRWSVIGWWKGSRISTDFEINMVTPKCHLVSVKRQDAEIRKWTPSVTSDSENESHNPHCTQTAHLVDNSHANPTISDHEQ
jgi:hypothetical protein